MIQRGDIYYADLSPVTGSEQGGIRPVLIVQNDIGNEHSMTIIVVAITAHIKKTWLPIHIELDAEKYGLRRNSVALCEQIRTIDKRRLRGKINHIDEKSMKVIDTAIAISLGLYEPEQNT